MSAPELASWIVATALFNVLFFFWGIRHGRERSVDTAVDQVWDTAVLLGSYGERLREQSRQTGIPVHMLVGLDLPQPPPGPCPFCGTHS